RAVDLTALPEQLRGGELGRERGIVRARRDAGAQRIDRPRRAAAAALRAAARDEEERDREEKLSHRTPPTSLRRGGASIRTRARSRASASAIHRRNPS